MTRLIRSFASATRHLAAVGFAAALVAAFLVGGAAPAAALDLGGIDMEADGPAPVDTSAALDMWSFDGFLVTNETITELCPDQTILDWGIVVDLDGQAVPGELWVLVGKGDRAVYYNLMDTPATGIGTFCGYMLKAKAITRITFLNYGEGADAPMIGNDEDGFLVVETDFKMNPLLKEGGQLIEAPDFMQDTEGSSAKLEAVGTIVTVRNLPRSTSGLQESALRWVWPDGSIGSEQIASMIASGSSDSEEACEAFGKNYASLPEAGLDLADFLLANINEVGVQVAPDLLTAGMASKVGIAVVEASGFVAGDVVAAAHEALFNTLDNTVVPLAEGLATAACTVAADLLQGALLDLDIVDIDFKGLGFEITVCDAWVTVPVGESSTYSDGEITVTVDTMEVCVRAHVEYVGF
jgi:hypothetical protein